MTPPPPDNGGGAAPREELEQAFEQAIEQARAQDRQDSFEATRDQVYPRPLPAGPQAYVDPGIWRGYETNGYKRALRLMDRLAAKRVATELDER